MWFDFKSILLKVDENHTNKTLLSVKYINTSFKGYKRHFPPKSQFPRAGAGLQAKHIGHLWNSAVELLHTGVDEAELKFMEQSSPKHPLNDKRKGTHVYI
jgi:hypothetical protein